MTSTILHAKVPAPGEQACRSGSLSTQVLPENNFAIAKVRVRRGGPGWSAGGWRVLPAAEVRRRPRRSSLPQNFGLPRRFVFTVEVIRRWPRSLACASREGSPAAAKVPLAVELRLAEEVRVRRGGSPVAAKVTMPWTAHDGVVLQAAACSTCKDEARVPLHSCFQNFRDRLQLSLFMKVSSGARRY